MDIEEEHVDSKMLQEKKDAKKKEKDVKKKEKQLQNKNVIYVGHLPHGFYEEELKDFFSQFGIVTRVKVIRSRKTGRSRCFAFVEFKYEEVAKIAAETMNNYLLYNKILKCSCATKQNNCWPKWDPSTFVSTVEKNRQKHNSKTTDVQNEKRKKRAMSKLKKISDKLAGLGIKYSLNVKTPKRRKSKEIENGKSEIILEENEKLSKLETPTKEENEETSVEANTDLCQLQDSLVRKTPKSKKDKSFSCLNRKASLTKKLRKLQSCDKNSRLQPEMSIQKESNKENSTEIKHSFQLKPSPTKKPIKNEEDIEFVSDSFSFLNRKSPLSKKSPKIQSSEKKRSRLESDTSMQENNEGSSAEIKIESCQLKDFPVKNISKNKDNESVSNSFSYVNRKTPSSNKSPKSESCKKKESRMEAVILVEEDHEESPTEVKNDSYHRLKDSSIKRISESKDSIELESDSFSYVNKKTPLSKKSPNIHSSKKKRSRVEADTSVQENNEESSAEIKADSCQLEDLSVKNISKNEDDESVSNSFSYVNRKTPPSNKSPKRESCRKKESRMETAVLVEEEREENPTEVKNDSYRLKDSAIKRISENKDSIEMESDSFSYVNKKTPLSKKLPNIQSSKKKRSRLESDTSMQENNEESSAEIIADSYQLKDLSVKNISKNEDDESVSNSFSYVNRKTPPSNKSPKRESCKKKESRMEPAILIEDSTEENPTEIKIDSSQLNNSSIKRISENKDSVEKETPFPERSAKLRSCKKNNSRLEKLASVQQNNEESFAELKTDSSQLKDSTIKKISKNNNDKSVSDSFSLDRKILSKRSPKIRSCKKKPSRLEPIISMQEDNEKNSADIKIDSCQLKDSVMKEIPKTEDNIESVSDSFSHLKRKTPLSKRSPKFRSCKKKNLRSEGATSMQEDKEASSIEIKSSSFSSLKRKQSSKIQSCKKMTSRLEADNLKQEDNEENSTEKKTDSCQTKDSLPKKKLRKNADIKSTSFVHSNTKTPLSKRSPKFRSCKKSKPV